MSDHLTDCNDCAYRVAQAEADGRRRGWHDALDAAAEAVCALNLHHHYAIKCEPVTPADWSKHEWCDVEDDVLQALDALREVKS